MRSQWVLQFLVAGLEVVTASTASDCLTVATDSGVIKGKIDAATPNVREFLSIPFAEPPIGDLRWLPPQKAQCDKNNTIDATSFPPSCPQYASKIPSVYTSIIPQSVINKGGQSNTAGASADDTSEDCLYLAIWTPTMPKTEQPLPVLMFMTGGGFNTGGINLDIQLPQHWVQRTQSHIVVTINYRLNIMGFPNAAGLTSQNVGLLDQRMALEWVRDNVAAFGGDPSRITLWGQSAGAGSADYQNFAYPSDPIANGFFMQSGSVFLSDTSKDTSHSNFSFVAANLGCGGGLSPSAELACMRKVPFDAIQDFIGGYGDNGTSPSIDFQPIADDQLVYQNYTERYSLGPGVGYADRPAIYSNNNNEGVSLIAFPKHPETQGPNQTLANQVTLRQFLCPAAKSSLLRSQHASSGGGDGNITYRYEYFGNFSNVSPLFWLGAYHSSDIPQIFGSQQDLHTIGGPSTPLEFQVSHSMQDHVLAFAQDPVNGPASVGWKSYAEGGLLQFARKDSSTGGIQIVQDVDVDSVDAVCKGVPVPPPGHK